MEIKQEKIPKNTYEQTMCNRKILILLLIAIFALAMIIMAIYFYIGSSGLSKYVLIEKPLITCQEEQVIIQKLINDNIILPPEVLHSSISGYYNSLITILVALLGAFSIIGAFAIKNITQANAEEMINRTIAERKNDVDKHIEEKLKTLSPDELTILKDKINPVIYDIMEEMGFFKQMEQIHSLEDNIRSLTETVSELERIERDASKGSLSE